VESATPAPEIEEQEVPAAPEASGATVQQQEATYAWEPTADALELEQSVSEEMAKERGPELSGDGAFTVEDELYAPHSAAPDSPEESLDAIARLAFGDGTDDFMVESFEPQPIALDPSDVAGMDVAVESMDEILSPSVAEGAADPFASDVTYDEMYSTAQYEEVRSAQPDASQEELESVERYLADEPALADEQGAAGDSVEVQAGDVDPWAGAELPEPAFGSIGWPSMGAGGAPPAPNPSVDGVDEMSAALAWSDDEDVVGTGEQHDPPSAGETSGSYDDALSSVVGELRDSSSAWKCESDSIVDEKADVAARAHFYAAPEPIDPLDEIAAAAEADAYALGLAAAAPNVEASGDAIAERPEEPATEAASGSSIDDHAGAAIADALSRVAARIRAGEVDLPSEPAGTSDESALAAALAALLRGPRR
jgi:hypothetical protein